MAETTYVLITSKISQHKKKVAEFIKFLPVLAYDGSSMKQIDATDILDIATSGTTATPNSNVTRTARFPIRASTAMRKKPKSAATTRPLFARIFTTKRHDFSV